MTTIETVGSIVGISAGVLGIFAAVRSELKDRRNRRELAAKDAEMVKKEIAHLKMKTNIHQDDIEKLEKRFNDFMSDMLKYFQIK